MKTKIDIADKATSRTGSKTTFVKFHSVVLRNFVSENVFAKWENFKDVFPGFCLFQFKVCSWNCVGRYRIIPAPNQTFARQLGDSVVCST